MRRIVAAGILALSFALLVISVVAAAGPRAFSFSQNSIKLLPV